MREGADWYLCASLHNCLFLPSFFKTNSQAAQWWCLGCRWFWKLHFPGETWKSLEPDSSAQRFPALPIAQALHCGGPWRARELPKLFVLFIYFLLPWRTFAQAEICLRVTLIAAGWAQLVSPVLTLPDLVTVVRHPAIATCHRSVQVRK